MEFLRNYVSKQGGGVSTDFDDKLLDRTQVEETLLKFRHGKLCH